MGKRRFRTRKECSRKRRGMGIRGLQMMRRVSVKTVGRWCTYGVLHARRARTATIMDTVTNVVFTL